MPEAVKKAVESENVKEKETAVKEEPVLKEETKEESKTESKDESKPKGKPKVNKKEEKQSTTVKAKESVAETKKLTRVKKEVADSFARKHIKQYDELSEGTKLNVRWTIASGKMYGVEESTIIALAKISADCKIGIGFAQTDGDGVCCSIDGEPTVYLNPNGKRLIETTVLHELTHIIKGVDGYDTIAEMARTYYKNNENKAQEIYNRYAKFYKENNMEFSKEIYEDELTAAYVESRLGSRKVLTDLVQEKPTFVKRCIERIKSLAKVLKGEAKAMDELQLLQNRFTSVYNMRKIKKVQDKNTTNEAQSENRHIINSVNKDLIDFNANMIKVSQMASVSELEGNEFELGDKRLYGQVEEYFNSIDNNAYNSILGDVELTRRGVKDAVAHGIGGKKQRLLRRYQI